MRWWHCGTDHRTSCWAALTTPLTSTCGVWVVSFMRWQLVDLCFRVPQWRRSFTSSSNCWVLPQRKAGLGSVPMMNLWRTTTLSTGQTDWVTTLPGLAVKGWSCCQSYSSLRGRSGSQQTSQWVIITSVTLETKWWPFLTLRQSSVCQKFSWKKKQSEPQSHLIQQTVRPEGGVCSSDIIGEAKSAILT